MASLNLRVKLIFAFVLVLIVTTLVSIFSFYAQNKRAETIKWLSHTQEVLRISDGTVMAAVNMETGFRGYIISGEDQFLEPFEAGKLKFGESLQNLKKATADNPSQVQRWEKVEKLGNQWLLEWAEKGIKLRQDYNAGKVTIVQCLAYESSGGGKKFMDAIREVIKEAQQIEENLLTQRSNADKQMAGLSSAILIWGTIGSIVLGLIIAYVFANSLSVPIGKTVEMLKELSKGHLRMRLQMSRKDEIGVMAQAMDNFADELQKVLVSTLQKIAEGDVSTEVTVVDSQDEIKPALKKVTESLRSLIAEMGMLRKCAVEGKLNTRSDVSAFKGAYKDIVQGVNDTLDAVTTPLNVAAEYVDKISKGDIPQKITDNYNGDFNVLKGNLNKCIDAVNLLVADANILSKASEDGKLETRADASKHSGDFKKIIEGVNSTLDAVIVPINEAQTVLEKVAKRDLSPRVMGEYKGDLAKIKTAINTAVDNLDKALQQVAAGTEQVSSAGQQISSGSQSLAQGANEQASSLEEVSSSLEEMASMTKQNAESANQAKALAGEANSNAAQGKQAMTRMSESINKIKESSDQTAKIVKTIDEIAMQTNLLALNAAVEAARAGEAGRGFAVVAEEVRNLAQRSAQAAKNTADMIAESVKNADDGVKIAIEVSKSFESIATGNAKVNDLIAEIAAASQEQTQGISQVNTAVAQMDKVTQQNAANSEESASAAEELSSQAEELQNMVGQFTLTNVGQKTAVKAAFHHEKTIAPNKTKGITTKSVLSLDSDDSALKEF